MIDHLFSAVLTFCLLAGGTVAVGSLMFEAPHTKAAQAAGNTQRLGATPSSFTAEAPRAQRFAEETLHASLRNSAPSARPQ